MSCLPLNLILANAYPTIEPVVMTNSVVAVATSRLLTNERPMGIFWIMDAKFDQVGCAGQIVIFANSCDGAKAAPIIQRKG